MRVSTPKPAATGNSALRAPGESATLARERLPHASAGAALDQRSRNGLRDRRGRPRRAASKTAIARSAPAVEQRPQVAAQVGVAEQERARRAHVALGERQRLPLAAARKPDDPRARGLGPGRRRVARAVVGDDDLGVGERLAQRRDRSADPLLLVARGDEHGEPVAHPSVGVGSGGGSGKTPSTAPPPIP